MNRIFNFRSWTFDACFGVEGRKFFFHVDIRCSKLTEIAIYWFTFGKIANFWSIVSIVASCLELCFLHSHLMKLLISGPVQSMHFFEAADQQHCFFFLWALALKFNTRLICYRHLKLYFFYLTTFLFDLFFWFKVCFLWIAFLENTFVEESKISSSFNTSRFSNWRRSTQEKKTLILQPCIIVYDYDGILYQTLINNIFLSNSDNISLSWHTDGATVFKSSKTVFGLFILPLKSYLWEFKKDKIIYLLY